jgi:hypothetical protein
MPETQASRLRFSGVIYFFCGCCTREWRAPHTGGPSSNPGHLIKSPGHIIIFNFGRMKEKLRWEEGARSATFCLSMSLKRHAHAVHGREARPNPLVTLYLFVNSALHLYRTGRNLIETHRVQESGNSDLYVRMINHVRSAACALCRPVRDSVRRLFLLGFSCTQLE